MRFHLRRLVARTSHGPGTSGGNRRTQCDSRTKRGSCARCAFDGRICGCGCALLCLVESSRARGTRRRRRRGRRTAHVPSDPRPPRIRYPIQRISAKHVRLRRILAIPEHLRDLVHPLHRLELPAGPGCLSCISFHRRHDFLGRRERRSRKCRRRSKPGSELATLASSRRADGNSRSHHGRWGGRIRASREDILVHPILPDLHAHPPRDQVLALTSEPADDLRHQVDIVRVGPRSRPDQLPREPLPGPHLRLQRRDRRRLRVDGLASEIRGSVDEDGSTHPPSRTPALSPRDRCLQSIHQPGRERRHERRILRSPAHLLRRPDLLDIR